MSEGMYFERGPVLMTVDPVHQEKYQTQKNPELTEIPKICSFSEYLRWNYADEYESVIRTEIEQGRLPLGNKTDYLRSEIVSVRLDFVEFYRTYLHSIDEISFRIDNVISAGFTAFFRDGQMLHDSQRYNVSGRVSFDEGVELFEKVDVYDSKAVSSSFILDEYLVPILKKSELDVAAERMLSKYLPDALIHPRKLNVRLLAENMGFCIQTARLSEDDSKLGSIFFDDTKVTFYHNGKKMTGIAKAGTILIDRQAHKNRNLLIDDTIVHECIHAFLHRLFYYFQNIYRSFVNESMAELEEMTAGDPSSDVLNWIENQAVHMTYRVRLPLNHTSYIASAFYDRYRKLTDAEAMEKVVGDLADYFGISKTAARNRMKDVGYDTARGKNQKANGDPVSGYLVGKEVYNDQTYIIDLSDMVEEYQRNEDFRKIIDSGNYVYAEGHICRNSPKYLVELPTGTTLTVYARTNMSECCLLFKVHHKKEYEYVYTKLDCIIEDDIGNLYIHDGKDIMKEASDTVRLMGMLPRGFADTMNFHMNNLNISVGRLSELSLLSTRTIIRMRTGNTKPSLETIVAVSIGMNLNPELSFDMLHKADREFDLTEPAHIWYMLLLRTMYRESIIKCNDLLERNRIPLLGAW